MIDYEAMILERQDLMEIWEDDPEAEILTDEDRDYFEAIFTE